MVAHLFSLAFIGVIAYFAVPGSSLFSWHPFLMTLGYIGFMFQAILVFSKESSLFVNMQHQTKVRVHWIFNTLGLIAILSGYAVIYYNKELNSKAHLTTWHGVVGLFTIGYTFMQFIAGHNLTIFYNMVRKITNFSYPKLAIFHATSGTFLFVCVCSSVCLGINSIWFSSMTPFYIWYFSFAVTGLFGLIVTNQVTSKYVKPKLGNHFPQPQFVGKPKKEKKSSKKTN